MASVDNFDIWLWSVFLITGLIYYWLNKKKLIAPDALFVDRRLLIGIIMCISKRRQTHIVQPVPMVNNNPTVISTTTGGTSMMTTQSTQQTYQPHVMQQQQPHYQPNAPNMAYA